MSCVGKLYSNYLGMRVARVLDAFHSAAKPTVGERTSLLKVYPHVVSNVFWPVTDMVCIEYLLNLKNN